MLTNSMLTQTQSDKPTTSSAATVANDEDSELEGAAEDEVMVILFRGMCWAKYSL